MLFTYDHEKLKTTDELKISLADLRDLIQAEGLKSKEKLNEYRSIISAIERKNKLPSGSIIADTPN